MKSLFLLLVAIICTSYCNAQFDNVPPGQDFCIIRTAIVDDTYNTGTLLVSKKYVFAPYYVKKIYTAPPNTDIVDGRFKLTLDPVNDKRFLVLLNNGRVIELTYDKTDDFWYSKNLHPLPIPGLTTAYEVLGDDLYVMAYEGIFVSDSGYNWSIDTVGLTEENPPIYNDIDIDTNQRVWLCTSNGLFTQELNVLTWIKNESYAGLYADRVYIDRKQNVWVSDFYTLWVSYDRGLTFTKAPAGLSKAKIEDISDDALGNIYVMSKNSLYYSHGGIQPFVQIDQPVMADFALFPSKQVLNDFHGDTLIYLSTLGGLYTSPDQGSTWNYDQSISAEHINSVSTTSNNHLLMTTNNGLYRLEDDEETWTKLYPKIGFVQGAKVYTANSGDLYIIAETIGKNSNNVSRQMVYRSTDNGNTFVPDTAGLGANDVAMPVFFVDESGVQHASSSIEAGGNFKRVWKKLPGQPWELDTIGLPAIMNFNYEPRFFGTDNNGKVYFALFDFSTGRTTIYSRPISGGAWISETIITGTAFDVKGRNGIATISSERGLLYNTGSEWKSIARPANTSPTIGWIASEVDNNNTIWAYYETYDNNGSLGQGVYYTTDFTTWNEPKDNIDSIIIGDLVAIGSSVFALTRGNDGVYVFDTTGVTAIEDYYTATGEDIHVMVIPNPLQDQSILQFDIKSHSLVSLVIHNVLGETILEIPAQVMNTGMQQMKVDLTKQPKGVYIYTLKINENVLQGNIMKD